MKAIITVGIPASGKTTKADELCQNENYININRDALRFSLFGVYCWDDYRFSRDKEALVTDIQECMVGCAWLAGKGVIISDTNLNKKVRSKWVEFLNDQGYDVEIMEFPITLEEAIKRDKNRLHCVGEEVILSMYKQWERYLEEK